MTVLLTLLVVACIMLAVSSAFLGWLCWDQRKTIDQLAETLIGVLRGKPASEAVRQWLREIGNGGGDAAGLSAGAGPGQ